MNLIDSCGWLEYFADGPNAGFFARPIEDVGNLVVPTLCILEVFKRMLQQLGERAALKAASTMEQGIVVDLDRSVAVSAAKISAQMKLSLADSVILATARAHDAVLWTQDAHFREIEGVRYTEAR